MGHCPLRLWLAVGLMDRLAGCMPEFVERLVAITAAAAEQGVHITWTSGLRTFQEQATLYRQGRDAAGRIVEPKRVVTFARPGFSWHNFGLAADFALVTDDATLEWSGLADLDADGVVDWLEVGRCAEAAGCIWGGRWPKLVDMPHVQWTADLALDEARRLYLESGASPSLMPVWQAVRQRAAGGSP